MIQSLSPFANHFLNDLGRLQNVIDTTTERVSSGFKINQPSDAPDQISLLLQLQASLSHNQTLASNLSNVQARISGADQAVGTALQLLDQARSIAAQGASSTSTAQTRATLAQQIQSIQQHLVDIADTQVAGHYVFSGDQDQTASYALDLTQPNGVQRLISPTATNRIELADRSTSNVDQTALTLFDHRNPDDSTATDNVFAALNALQTALTNNDQAGIISAGTSIQTASDYLNSQETFFGNSLTLVNQSVDRINSENTTFQQQISSIRDTDQVQAALQLTSAENQQQAAFSAEAKRPNTSLFDYLG